MLKILIWPMFSGFLKTPGRILKRLYGLCAMVSFFSFKFFLCNAEVERSVPCVTSVMLMDVMA